MAPSWHDWKIVDWDVKPQHNQQLDWAESQADLSLLGSQVILLVLSYYSFIEMFS